MVEGGEEEVVDGNGTCYHPTRYTHTLNKQSHTLLYRFLLVALPREEAWCIIILLLAVSKGQATTVAIKPDIVATMICVEALVGSKLNPFSINCLMMSYEASSAAARTVARATFASTQAYNAAQPSSLRVGAEWGCGDLRV